MFQMIASGIRRILSKAKAADWSGKVAAYEEEKQALYAEIGRLTTQLTWLKKGSQFGE